MEGLYLCTAKKKAERAAEEDEFSIHTYADDDFGKFVAAKQVRDCSQQQLPELLNENEWQPDSSGQLRPE